LLGVEVSEGKRGCLKEAKGAIFERKRLGLGFQRRGREEKIERIAETRGVRHLW
jgi:hypothetical protein